MTANAIWTWSGRQLYRHYLWVVMDWTDGNPHDYFRFDPLKENSPESCDIFCFAKEESQCLLPIIFAKKKSRILVDTFLESWNQTDKKELKCELSQLSTLIIWMRIIKTADKDGLWSNQPHGDCFTGLSYAKRVENMAKLPLGKLFAEARVLRHCTEKYGGPPSLNSGGVLFYRQAQRRQKKIARL